MNVCIANHGGTQMKTRLGRPSNTGVGTQRSIKRRLHRDVNGQTAASRTKRAKGDGFWVCRIGGRVVGAIGISLDGLDEARISLFRVDPEWRHTSVPQKLIERVRVHARRRRIGRIVAEPQLAPRWLFQSFSRHGFRFAGWRRISGRELLEFWVERDQLPA
jgi:N-acetylglutamate synthase-like GNAT family acetyltransferase